MNTLRRALALAALLPAAALIALTGAGPATADTETGTCADGYIPVVFDNQDACAPAGPGGEPLTIGIIITSTGEVIQEDRLPGGSQVETPDKTYEEPDMADAVPEDPVLCPDGYMHVIYTDQDACATVGPDGEPDPAGAVLAPGEAVLKPAGEMPAPAPTDAPAQSDAPEPTAPAGTTPSATPSPAATDTSAPGADAKAPEQLSAESASSNWVAPVFLSIMTGLLAVAAAVWFLKTRKRR
ncbi:hypothetical protein [Pseudarthrobacter sp. S9]|uniref:hypothetical protein n=1 Tax=Pseudarthrobacter sp. S9 TaxID=3418421 RepID=UPI003D03D8A7